MAENCHARSKSKPFPSRWFPVVLVAMTFCAGCKPSPPTRPDSARSSTDPALSVEPTASIDPTAFVDPAESLIVDRLNREVSSTIAAKRIVSLSPATTELLFALGIGERVVGATEHCNYPPPAKQVPRVGTGMIESISSEQIVGLKPDLVLVKGDTHQPLIGTLERLNLRVCAVGGQSLDELFEETRWIGRLTDRRQQADELIKRMQARHAELLEIVTRYQHDPPIRVFYEVWDEPLMTAAPNSFIGEMLSQAGLENILVDTEVPYPRISSETVVEGNPELILAPSTHVKKIDVQSFQSRPGWSAISAVVNERIALISGDEVSRCGPRQLEALAQIILAAYPEAAAELSPSDGDAEVTP